jgi:hypothetical protein
MSARRSLGSMAAGGALFALLADLALAQGPSFVPRPPVSQTQEYETSLEEYDALKMQANGGTKHTAATIPDWRGVWSRQIRGPVFSFDESAGRNPDLTGPYGNVSASLTPKYLADYQNEVKVVKEGRDWDRLSYCLPAGFPRWLTEPWLREFIATPDQTWLIHEQINEIRRIYTDGRPHLPVGDLGPQWMGESVGFWDGDTLVVHTTNLKAGWYQRGQPAYSFETSTVERWRKIDTESMLVEVTVYDPAALAKPWHAEFNYRRNMDPNVRVQYNSCVEGNNIVRRSDGGGTFVLPGNPAYRDPNSFGIPDVAMDTLPQ